MRKKLRRLYSDLMGLLAVWRHREVLFSAIQNIGYGTPHDFAVYGGSEHFNEKLVEASRRVTSARFRARL